MPRTDCLTPDELNAFHLGDVAEGTLAEFAGHLETCARCEAAARALDSVSDSVVAAYRQCARSVLTAPPAADAAPPPQRVGDYEILGELGRGGMGVVYKARHLQLHRTVALKMLLSGAFARPAELARFKAEAEAVARLQHAGIVQIFDIGEYRDGDGTARPYFTLELAEGGSLADRLAGRPQSPRQAAAWLEALARGSHCAHARGVVHRDLKPSNVLLTADGQPKICDFGIAKFLAGSGVQTLSGTVLGTAEYIAPEQVCGRAVGPAVDVWALGVILYECLTGRPPFRGGSAWHTLEEVTGAEPVPPSRLNAQVPRDLETITLKCMEKDPKRRYVSAEALADDLRRFLEGRPVKARPLGPLGRGARWCRRNPWPASALAAVAATVVVAFVWINGEKEAARALADENARLAREEGAARKDAQEALANRTAALKERDAAARRAEAVHDYLIRDMLGSAGLRRTRGETLTVREVLDRAAAGVAQRFAKEPEQEEVVRDMLGRAYLNVGKPRDALAQFTARVALCRRVHGEAHPRTLDARVKRVGALNRCADYAAARKESDQLLPAVRQALGAEDALTLELRAEAARTQHHLGQSAEARQALEEVIAIRRRLSGPEHMQTLEFLSELATVLIKVRRPADACRLCEEQLPVSRRVLGPEHETTLGLQNQYALALLSLGRVEDAAKECEALLPALRRTLGPEHLDALLVSNNVACVLMLRQRPADACRLFDECLPGLRRLLGEEDVRVLQAEATHGFCLVAVGRNADAETLYDRLLPLQRRLLPATDAGRLLSLVRCPIALQKLGKHAKAEPVLRELLEARRKAFSTKHWLTGEAEILLGNCLTHLTRYADAEAVLLAGHERLVHAKGPSAPAATVRLGVSVLVSLYQAWGKTDEAARWRARLSPGPPAPPK